MLVRSGDPDNPGVFTVTGPTKRKLRPGTEGLSPLDGFEVRNEGGPGDLLYLGIR